MINLGEVRAERDAIAVATDVLANLAVIQTRLISYFHVDLGNPATDAELGATGLLYALAEELGAAARTLQSASPLVVRSGDLRADSRRGVERAESRHPPEYGQAAAS